MEKTHLLTIIQILSESGFHFEYSPIGETNEGAEIKLSDIKLLFDENDRLDEINKIPTKRLRKA